MNSHTYVSVDGTTENGTLQVVKHDKSDWEAVKSYIQQKYGPEKKPTKLIRSEMQIEHRFHASIQQYERQFKRWDWRKTIQRSVYDAVNGTLKQKLLDAEQVEISIDGTPIPRKKMKKAMQRRNLPTLFSKWEQDLPSPKERTEVGVTISHDIPTIIDALITVRPVLKPGLRLDPVDASPIFDLLSWIPQPLLSHRTSAEAFSINTYARLFPATTSTESPLTRSTLEAILPDKLLEKSGLLDSALASQTGQRDMSRIAKFLFLLSNSFTNSNASCEIGRIFQEPDFASFLRWLVALRSPTSIAICQRLLTVAIDGDNIYRLNLLYKCGVDIETKISVFVTHLRRYMLGTALHYAVYHRRSRVLDYLIEFGARTTQCAEIQDAHRRGSPSADHHASRCCHCATLPINLALRSAEKSWECLKTLLHASTYICSDCFSLRGALSKRIDVVTVKKIHELCPLGLLLSNEANDGVVVGYYSSLQLALDQNMLDIALLLIKQGAEVKIRTKGATLPRGDTCISSPLTLALSRGYLDLARQLLIMGADSNGCYLDDEDVDSESDFPKWQVSKYGKSPYNGILSRSQNIHATTRDIRARLELDRHMFVKEYEQDYSLYGHRDHDLRCYPIQGAILSGNIDCVNLLLDAGAKLCPAYGINPLYLAIRKRNIPVVQSLLSMGVARDQCERMFSGTSYGRTPLVRAVMQGDYDISVMLIEAGADVLYRSKNGVTPLEAAIWYGSTPECISLMLQHSVTQDTLGIWKLRFGCNMLDLVVVAIRRKRLKVARSLLTFHLELSHQPSACSFWELMNCRSMDFEDHLTIDRPIYDDDWFYDLCMKPTRPEDSYQFNSHRTDQSAQDDAKVVSDIIQLGQYLTAQILVTIGLPLLLHAIKTGNMEMIMYLIQQGVQICSEAWEALFKMWSQSTVQCSEIIRILEMSRYIPDVMSRSITVYKIVEQIRDDSLYSDRRKHRTRLVEQLSWLLENGFDVDGPDTLIEGKTPLMLACGDSNLIDVVGLLLYHGANVSQRCYPKGYIEDYLAIYIGVTALGCACLSGNIRAIDMLLATKVEINAPANNGDEPCLAISARRGHQDAVLRLIQAGASTKIAVSNKKFARTPLQAACGQGHLDIVTILINENSDINAAAGSNRGVTALQAAAMKGHLKICQILVGCGAKVAAAKSKRHGRTAIDGAAEQGHLDTVQYLLDRYDGNEKMALVCARARAYAVKHCHLGVMALLDGRIAAAPTEQQKLTTITISDSEESSNSEEASDDADL